MKCRKIISVSIHTYIPVYYVPTTLSLMRSVTFIANVKQWIVRHTRILLHLIFTSNKWNVRLYPFMCPAYVQLLYNLPSIQTFHQTFDL